MKQRHMNCLSRLRRYSTKEDLTFRNSTLTPQCCKESSMANHRALKIGRDHVIVLLSTMQSLHNLAKGRCLVSAGIQQQTNLSCVWRKLLKPHCTSSQPNEKLSALSEESMIP